MVSLRQACGPSVSWAPPCSMLGPPLSPAHRDKAGWCPLHRAQGGWEVQPGLQDMGQTGARQGSAGGARGPAAPADARPPPTAG